MTTKDKKGGIDLPQDSPDSLSEAERLFANHGSETVGAGKPRGMYLRLREEKDSECNPESRAWRTEGVECLPVEDAYKWWSGYFRTCWMIAKSPAKAFALPAPTYGGYPWKFILSTIFILVGVPLLIILLIAFLGGLFSGGLSVAIKSIFILLIVWAIPVALVFLIPLASLAIGGAITHLFIKLVHRQAKSLHFTYRAIGYSLAAVYPTIPFWLIDSPLINEYRTTGNTAFYIAFIAVNLIVAIYVLYVQAAALAATHGCGKVKIVLVWVIASAVVWGLVFAFGLHEHIMTKLLL